MPIYRVTLKDPTTPHAPFLIRAPLARVAQRTAVCMLHASVPKAAQGATPNLDPELTTCVQVHDSGYPEAGPLEILEPAPPLSADAARGPAGGHSGRRAWTSGRLPTATTGCAYEKTCGWPCI